MAGINLGAILGAVGTMAGTAVGGPAGGAVGGMLGGLAGQAIEPEEEKLGKRQTQTPQISQSSSAGARQPAPAPQEPAQVPAQQTPIQVQPPAAFSQQNQLVPQGGGTFENQSFLQRLLNNG